VLQLIEQIIVITAVFLMFVAMIKEIAHPSIVAFLTLIFFLIIGFTTPEGILESVSNEGVITLALLFIIASVIEKTHAVEKIIFYILKSPTSERGALLRMMSPLIGLSAFFNNTPIVVMMVPAIQAWCRERGLYASKFLIPISYATIFGGMFTIIGTSTNLIVHGWLLGKGYEGFTFFHTAPYAIFGVVVGIMYLYFVGYKLLPKNDTQINARYHDSKKYLYEAMIEEGCTLIGKTVVSPEFRELKNLYLIKIMRTYDSDQTTETISPVGPDEVFHAGDVLVFTGTLEHLQKLDVIKHLSIKAGQETTIRSLQTGNSRLIEVLVSDHSSFVHQQIKDTQFRTNYNASIIAVHRQNERIEKNLSDIRLRPGDILLLLAGPDFEYKAHDQQDFYLLTSLPKRTIFNKKQLIVSIGSFIAMIIAVTLGFVTMLMASLICLVVYLLFDLLEPEQVKNSVSYQVLLLIVASLGVGKVIESSGTASLIATNIIKYVGFSLGAVALLATIYLLTNILTEIVTNTAAAVIMLPIAVEVGDHLSMAPSATGVVVAIAASASFSTPIGYQTNLIVYGPGGYTFSDYVKVGLPLNIIFLLTTITSVYFLT